MTTETLADPATAPAEPITIEPAPSLQPPPTAPVGVQPDADEDTTPDDGEAASPPWTQAKTADELFELPDVKSRVEESTARARKDGLSEAQSRMQPFLQRQTEHVASVDQQVAAFVKSWNKLLKPDANGYSALTEEAASALMDEHKGAFDAIAGLHSEAGVWQGARGLIADLSKELNVDLDPVFAPRLEQMRRGLPDPTIFSDLIEQVTGARITQEKTKWEKEIAPKIEARVRAELTASVNGKKDDPPKVQGKSRPSGITKETARNLTPEQILEYRAAGRGDEVEAALR